MSVTADQHGRTSTPAVAVSVVLGTAALTLMALRLPSIDLPTQLSLASGLPLWALFALVTLVCIVGLSLTRGAASTGSAAVGRFLNVVVGLIALLATGITGWPVHGLIVWIVVGILVILGVVSALSLRRPVRADMNGGPTL